MEREKKRTAVCAGNGRCRLLNLSMIIPLVFADQGLENEPRNAGGGVTFCFYMRLKRAMEYAKSGGSDAAASVLGARL